MKQNKVLAVHVKLSFEELVALADDPTAEVISRVSRKRSNSSAVSQATPSQPRPEDALIHAARTAPAAVVGGPRLAATNIVPAPAAATGNPRVSSFVDLGHDTVVEETPQVGPADDNSPEARAPPAPQPEAPAAAKAQRFRGAGLGVNARGVNVSAKTPVAHFFARAERPFAAPGLASTAAWQAPVRPAKA